MLKQDNASAVLETVASITGTLQSDIEGTCGCTYRREYIYNEELNCTEQQDDVLHFRATLLATQQWTKEQLQRFISTATATTSSEDDDSGNDSSDSSENGTTDTNTADASTLPLTVVVSVSVVVGLIVAGLVIIAMVLALCLVRRQRKRKRMMVILRAVMR